MRKRSAKGVSVLKVYGLDFSFSNPPLLGRVEELDALSEYTVRSAWTGFLHDLSPQ